MSKITDLQHKLYFDFQKIFNNFDIYLKRDLVSTFINDLGNTALQYFKYYILFKIFTVFRIFSKLLPIFSYFNI